MLCEMLPSPLQAKNELIFRKEIYWKILKSCLEDYFDDPLIATLADILIATRFSQANFIADFLSLSVKAEEFNPCQRHTSLSLKQQQTNTILFLVIV